MRTRLVELLLELILLDGPWRWWWVVAVVVVVVVVVVVGELLHGDSL